MAESWHVAKGKTKLGPYTREQLKRLAQAGQLQPSDMVLPDGSAKWTQAITVAGLFTRPQPPAAAPPKRKEAPPKSETPAPAKRKTPAPTPTPTPAKRSKGKLLVMVGAALAACACLVAVPASLVIYFFVLTPERSAQTAVAAAATNAVDTPPPAPAPANLPAPTTLPTQPAKADAPKVDPPSAAPPASDPPQVDPPMADPPPANPPKSELPKNPPAGDTLTPEARQKVKQATVFLRVTLPNGSIAEGSGFIGGARNVVLTNGHVLGMLSPEGRPPQKIVVVVNSGTPEEKTYIGKLGQIDARDDLAAVILNADDLPPPLNIGRAKDLFETQAVFVFGFPFGSQLGKNISVSKTTVSSIRTKPGGAVQDIVVGGGMNPGNSGGPVVDANGLVVGVSVAIIKGTQINFAIAGETVQSFLAGRMDKRVYLSPYKEGDQLKLPIRYDLTDPLGRVAKVIVETWTGKPGSVRPVTDTGTAALPDDSPRRSYELGYKRHKAEGEVDLPVMQGDQALWVQLALVRRDGSKQWYPASTYPNKLAPVERKPVTLTYVRRPETPYKLELTETTDLKMRGIDGRDKHFVTEIKGLMTEQLIGQPDKNGMVPGILVFKKLTVKNTVDKVVQPDPILDKSLQSLAALRALTLITSQGDVKPAGMAIDKSIRNLDTRADLTYYGMQLLQAMEAVTVPLPGREVRHEEPWKVKREILLGSAARSAKQAVMDVDCILHGQRERNGRPEAVVFLFGQVRGAPGAALSAGGYMDGQAVVDLKTNQVRFAEANLNLDLDLTDGKEHVQATGTRKISLIRTPLEGAERDQVVKGSGQPAPMTPPSGPMPTGPMPTGPAPGGPNPMAPVAGGRTRIQGGVNDPEFSEAAPVGGLLVGFEIGLQRFGKNDVVRAMRPIFRVGDNESLGTQRGTILSRVVRVVAKPGYAVGAITAKAGLTVDGMSVTFMKVTPDGRLDPSDAYESNWIGGRGGGPPMRLDGNGTPVIGVIGRANMRDMTGLGLLLRL